MDISGAFSGFKRVVSENSPKILLIGGLISFGATVVLASYESTKLSKIVDKHKEEMDKINNYIEEHDGETDENEEVEYSIEDSKKDKFIITCKTVTDIVKLYAPAFIAGVFTVVCFLSSYKVLSTRYFRASALACSLSDAFLAYRKRVSDELGKEMEEHFYYDTDKIKITEIDPGKKKPIEREEEILRDSNNIPIYAKFFDEVNPNWTKNPQTNLFFLKGMQTRANDLFQRDGVLLLNDVYRMLNIEITEIGNEVGWFKKHGDQFVDFGIFDGSCERKRAFVNGYEPSILLNFNCSPKKDGDIARF